MTRTESDKEFYENRKQKRLLNPPCAMKSTDGATGLILTDYPSVICGFHCESCGWNPEVKKKRVEKMIAESALSDEARARYLFRFNDRLKAIAQ